MSSERSHSNAYPDKSCMLRALSTFARKRSNFVSTPSASAFVVIFSVSASMLVSNFASVTYRRNSSDETHDAATLSILSSRALVVT